MPVLFAQGDDQASARSKAMALEQRGLSAEAEQAWLGIVKADPNNSEALAHLGLLEARQDHLDAAISYYRRAKTLDPELPGLEMNLGLALFKAAQFPDALKSFSSEIRKNPGDQRLTILVGMSHFGMKDYLVAIPYLERATDRDPRNLILRLTLSQSCMRSKQYKCVVDVYKQTLALNIESAEMDMIAGEALDAEHDRNGAIKQFRAAVLVNPMEPNVHFGLGYLLWTRGQWMEAAGEFQLELRNDPQHVKARIYLADSWLRQNDFAKALPELERLAASDPSEPLIHRDLGIAYADAKRTQDAVRELNMALEYGAEDAELHVELARLYRALGRGDEANAELDKARRLGQETHPSLQEMIDSPEASTP